MRKPTLIASVFAAGTALAFAAGPLAGTASASGGGGALFVHSATEHADGTVTLPLHQGTSHGQTVYYVLLETSDGAMASQLGLNRSQKLAHAHNTASVEKISIAGGKWVFPATVNFAPVRRVVAGPHGFPPASATPGAVGEAGYSPLVQSPGGVIYDAPQVANGTGRADKVVSIDLVHKTVTYRETDGFANGKHVRYASFDSSDPAAAALEASTYAPALNAAPTVGQDGTDQSRASLAAFTNGQTGAANPQRQGLNSAVLDGLSPLNVLRWTPNQGRYSPLWDVHLAAWSPSAVAGHTNTRQTDYGTVLNLASHGRITAPNGSPFAASGFIVNCPVISQS
jgi:hypothetical protein